MSVLAAGVKAQAQWVQERDSSDRARPPGGKSALNAWMAQRGRTLRARQAPAHPGPLQDEQAPARERTSVAAIPGKDKAHHCPPQGARGNWLD